MEAKRPRSHRHSRREFVVAGAAAGVGAAGAVAAVAATDHRHRARPAPQPLTSTTAAQADIVVLGGLLELERRTVAAYSQALLALAGAERELVRTILGHEREHALAIARAIRDLGASPSPPLGGDLAGASSVAGAAADGLRSLRTLEEQSLGAYIDAVEEISTEDVRVTVAAVMAAEAEHSTAISAALGGDALQTPFPVGIGGASQS